MRDKGLSDSVHRKSLSKAEVADTSKIEMIEQEIEKNQSERQLSSSKNSSRPASSLIQSKKQFYSKQEAEELMQEEYQRRKDEAATRIAAAKKLLAAKTHQIIVEEIAERSKNQANASISQTADNQIKELEDAYRTTLFGIPGHQITFDIHSQCNTQESQTQKAQQNLLEENDIIEEVAQLSEKPHPQPLNPINCMQVESIDYLPDNNRPSNIQQVEKQSAKKLEIKRGRDFEPQSFKSPDAKMSSKPNHNHQILFQKTMISPQTRVFYRNNFSKDSKFVEKNQREQMKNMAAENLKQELDELVQTYDRSKGDNDKVEDMILELNRLTQKSNGKVPVQQHAKLQQYVSDLEMHKATYSNKKKSESRSPSRGGNSATPIKAAKFSANVPLRPPQNININSEKLKEIIINTESKVKQSLRSLRSGGNSSYTTQRESIDKQYMSPSSQQLISNQSQNNDLKQQIQDALVELNARSLSQFLKRKTSSLRLGDYEVGYLLALLAALVDESIPLTNDKSDISQKSWEEIARQLSNHGKIIYSLQKLRFLHEKEDFQKSLNKIQFIKRFNEYKSGFSKCHESARPVIQFLSKIADIIQQIKASQAQSHSVQPEKSTNRTLKTFHQKKNSCSSSYYHSKQFESPVAANAQNLSSHRGVTSPLDLGSSIKTPKPATTIQGQLLQQKQMAIEKTYMLQLEQSRELRNKELKAYQKQIEIARMKMEAKTIQARLNREDKIKFQEEVKKQEQDYIKYSSDFRHRMSSMERSTVESEKLRVREKSIENQEFKQQQKQKQKDQEIKQFQEESMKSLQDLQWKTKQLLLQREKKAAEIKKKQEELLLSKVKVNEQFLNHKEGELDERLKNQFEQASHRFRQLKQQEESLKKEMSVLAILQESRQKK